VEAGTSSIFPPLSCAANRLRDWAGLGCEEM
jgi:hypothetical protein